MSKNFSENNIRRYSRITSKNTTIADGLNIASRNFLRNPVFGEEKKKLYGGIKSCSKKIRQYIVQPI